MGAVFVARVLAMVMMIIISIMSSSVFSADPDPLQDLCVADLNSDVIVNGYPCKNNATAEDFHFAGLARPAPIRGLFGSQITPGNVMVIPGLNTLGVSMNRVDVAPGGLNPPHSHPRASEILFLLYGELEVGFVTTANVLITTTIKEGENFVFPRGLIHFQINNGRVPAAFIAAFNSQLPGVQIPPVSLFGATPPLPDNVLAKAFQIDDKMVEEIKSKFAHEKYISWGCECSECNKARVL